MATTVTWKWDGLDRLMAGIDKGSGDSGAYGRMYKRVGRVLLAFWQARYITLSKGGSVDGDSWPKLKPATIRRRRKRTSVILRDTGLLLSALSPEIKRRGQQLRQHGRGIRVGFSEAAHEGADLTFAELAHIHHHGLGTVPPRSILVEPDEPTKRILREVMMEGIEDTAKGR